MDRSKRRIQLSRDAAFENLLMYRLDRQMVHSHSGLGTFCTKWVSLWNEPAHVVATTAMRKTLAYCWQARSLLLWLNEIAAAASEPRPCKLLAFASDDALDDNIYISHILYICYVYVYIYIHTYISWWHPASKIF